MVRLTVPRRESPDDGLKPEISVRSRKVRKVLKLDGRAERLIARHACALACAAPLFGRAAVLRREARAVELTLTGTELGELQRARSGHRDEEGNPAMRRRTG